MSKQKSVRPKERAQMVDGELMLTIKDFAIIVNKSEQTIRGYMRFGNRIRKMKMRRIVGKPMIPFSELMEFPFTISGHFTEADVYHYSEEGVVLMPVAMAVKA